jgi:hypothetical protein
MSGWLALGIGFALSTTCLVRNVWGGWTAEESGDGATDEVDRKRRNVMRAAASVCHCGMGILLKLRFF